MSKKLVFAFVLACISVSFAAFQIHRYWDPQVAHRRYGGGVLQEAAPANVSPRELPLVPGQLPTLRSDPATSRKFELVHDHLEAESWVEAIHILQTLLDGAEDALVSVPRLSPDGGETAVWTGSRAEAQRMLASLPPGGRDFYETVYGPRARALLAEVRQKDDPRLLADVARRFPFTAAGSEALDLLGTYHLDRGRYHFAALCFERLLGRADSSTAAPATWLRTALALQRAGEDTRAQQAWQRLTALAPEGVRLGGKDIGLADARREWEPIGRGGDSAGVPSLQSKWTFAATHEGTARTWLQSALQKQSFFAQPFLSAFRPLLVGDRVVFRSHRGLHALQARTGQEIWYAPSSRSLDQLMLQPEFQSSVQDWAASYLEYNSAHTFIENGVLGTLSTDGERIYAVDDLGIPPYRKPPTRGGRWMAQTVGPEPPPALTEATLHNRLLALDARTGQQLWTVGGFREDAENAELYNTYFLGAPLPLDGRLYALAEKNSELRLVCLDRSGALLWKQPLAFAPLRLLYDPGRRIQASRPVFAEGMLVCPTNAGVIVGVDLLSQGLAWAYPYSTSPLTFSEPTLTGRGRARASPPVLIAMWKAPGTWIQDGRVVFAAPDAASIHCLDVRDGSLRWKVERTEDDLYVAGVFSGKVLVVGQHACRALNLADGKQAWQLETGLPSGLGTAEGGIYYLPLRSVGRDHEPAVFALDVARGAIAARTYAPRRDVPGNLLLANGQVFAHTGTAVIAYEGAKDPPQ
jgi:outer membrane protein assembly factor BamB